MNLKDLEKKISKKTKAIMPVHAFGLSADMDGINSIARKHHLPVIEDAACALGSTYYGKQCGSLGEIGCFSFHPRKAITTGEGGMITTNNKNLAEKMMLLRTHGGQRKNGRYSFTAAGYNYRMSDIQAAVGVAQMRKLNVIIKKRQKLAQKMSKALQNIASIKVPFIPDWGGHVYQSFVLLLDSSIDRDGVIQKMKKRNIETTLGTYALHEQPFFQKTYGYKKNNFKNAHIAFCKTLTIPLYPQMTKADINLICRSLESIL